MQWGAKEWALNSCDVPRVAHFWEPSLSSPIAFSTHPHVAGTARCTTGETGKCLHGWSDLTVGVGPPLSGAYQMLPRSLCFDVVKSQKKYNATRKSITGAAQSWWFWTLYWSPLFSILTENLSSPHWSFFPSFLPPSLSPCLPAFLLSKIKKFKTLKNRRWETRIPWQ